MKAINLSDTKSLFTGALDFDSTEEGITPRRLPAFTRLSTPDEMQRVIRTPSGVRIEFRSDTTEIELRAHLTLMKAGRNLPTASVDLLIDGRYVATASHQTGDILQLISATDMKREPGPGVCFKFPGLPKGDKHIALWLPVNAETEIRGLSVDDHSFVKPIDGNKAVWIHHGSSISHCSEAQSPTQTWPAVAAEQGNVALANLGFGGQCHLDQFVAQSIREMPADYISLKIGINIVNQNSLGRRTFASSLHGFLDTIRSGHPHTPILLISPIYCPFSEDAPGPTTASIQPVNGKKQLVFGAVPGHDEVRLNSLTLKQMRRIIFAVVAARQQAGDAALGYLDGLELFSESDKADLPDNLHPNAAGYIRMGQRFADIAFSGGLFSRLV
ncbi:MAG: lysophospholipase L1-like esterase [Granulosicoccus sp.]|jgi:lysophospholipase L1-like esterase